NRSISRIRVAVSEFMHHRMAVIGSHIYLPDIILESIHQGYHIGISFQMICFVKVFIFYDLHASQMKKMYSVPVFPDHVMEIIVRPGTQGKIGRASCRDRACMTAPGGS